MIRPKVINKTAKMVVRIKAKIQPEFFLIQENHCKTADKKNHKQNLVKTKNFSEFKQFE